MGSYLNNLLQRESGEYVLEHKQKPGWFLFDIDYIETMTTLTWFNQHQICLKWKSREAIEAFIYNINVTTERVKIIKIGDIHET